MTQFANSIGQLSSTQQGIFVACILLSGSLSSLSSGYISDKMSRKYGILAGGLIIMIGTALSAVGVNFGMLVAARIITGIGMGQAISVTTVYLVELAAVETRGTSACLFQLYAVLGILMGYFITFGTQSIGGSFAWRIPFIIQSIFALFLTVGMFYQPASPRWLINNGRINEARAVLQRLRSTPEEAESEVQEIEASANLEMTGIKAPICEMLSPRYWRRTCLGVFLMAFQQLTGVRVLQSAVYVMLTRFKIDAVLYFAPILFQQAGLTSTSASFLASGVTGIVNLAFTIPAQIWIDKWGRRKPLIIGGSAISLSLIITGSLYATYGFVTESGVQMRSTQAQWVVVVMIYIFVANFAWSWAVVGKIYAAEINPTRLRASVSAVGQLANWAVNFVVALTAPAFLRSSPSGPYFLYGFATLLAVAVCWFMPETKGKTLEEIEMLFEKGRWQGPESGKRPSVASGGTGGTGGTGETGSTGSTGALVEGGDEKGSVVEKKV